VLVGSASSTARGVIQADVDANELAATTDRVLIRSEFAAADVVQNTASSTARGVIQADVDANQAAGITDRALIRSQFAAADLVLTNAVAAHTVTLATKQDTIANDHLQIAHTAGLVAKHAAQDALISTNTGKTTYGDSALVASHTVSIAANTTAVGLKHPALTTSSLFHDTTNHRLGVGTVSPAKMIHVHDTGGAAQIQISRSLDDNHVTFNSGGLTKYGNGGGSTAFRIRQVTADPIWIETSNTKAIVIDPNCNVECKQNLTVEGNLVLEATVPASATATGVTGQVRVGTGFIYACVATNTWQRIAIATW
jgi:hypothetical protein